MTTTERLKKLQELYAEIPSFECKPNCHDCCGPVFWSFDEWRQIDDKRVLVDINCPYIEDGCAIYDHRPFLCRLIGTSEVLPCPHGCKPEVMIPAERANEMHREYMKLMKASWKYHQKMKRRKG